MLKMIFIHKRFHFRKFWYKRPFTRLSITINAILIGFDIFWVQFLRCILAKQYSFE